MNGKMVQGQSEDWEVDSIQIIHYSYRCNADQGPRHSSCLKREEFLKQSQSLKRIILTSSDHSRWLCMAWFFWVTHNMLMEIDNRERKISFGVYIVVTRFWRITCGRRENRMISWDISGESSCSSCDFQLGTVISRSLHLRGSVRHQKNLWASMSSCC